MPDRPHHSEKFKRCLDQVMAKGHSQDSSYAICTASFQGAGEDIYANAAQNVDDGKSVEWHRFVLGKPFKPFKKKRPDEQKDAKPKWTPPWLKK